MINVIALELRLGEVFAKKQDTCGLGIVCRLTLKLSNDNALETRTRNRQRKN